MSGMIIAMFQGSSSQGSGSVLNPTSTIPLSNPNVDFSSIQNSINSIIGKGYFILYNQIGVPPLLSFILVTIMITVLIYMFGSLFFRRVLNQGQLFEDHIRRPLIILSIAIGLFGAYTIGYLVYIFQYILYVIAGIFFAMIIILGISMGMGTYRAGRAMMHAVATKEYGYARTRYQAESLMYDARRDLARVKYDVKALERLLKKKHGKIIPTGEFREYRKILKDIEKHSIEFLDGVQATINSYIWTPLRNQQQTPQTLQQLDASLASIVNAANNYLNGVQQSFNNIQTFYNNLIHQQQNTPGQQQAVQLVHFIHTEIFKSKNKINAKINDVNALIQDCINLINHLGHHSTAGTLNRIN
ncbi:hypothetical protein YN1_2730 [Nanoarchaeota archaeon]